MTRSAGPWTTLWPNSTAQISTHMKYLLITAAVLALGACGDQYRYPCQDPQNWDKALCQKPLCDVNRTCPEHIFKGADPTKMFPPGSPVPEGLRALQAAPAVPVAPAKPFAPPQTGTCR